MARFRLLPRDERFFDLFELAADEAIRGADTLQQLLNDMPNFESYRRKMTDIEHAADKINHEAMDKLNRTFITPIDPEDIRVTACRLDDIIDCTHAAVERIVLYRVTVPHPAALELTEVLVQATTEVKAMVAGMRDFSNRAEILLHCIEINRLENVGDGIYREALGSLYLEDDLRELIRWKEIFDQIEQAIDQCEDLADSLELTLTKHT